MLEWLPEGQSGVWKVEHFEISEMDSRLSFFSYGARLPRAGKYTRLTRNNHVIMSDTPAEVRDLWGFEHNAKGNILINGLGLGIATKIALDKDPENTVTVIEISEDVIALVGKYLKNLYWNRLNIVQADALSWQPEKGKRYNSVWHDIWDDICIDNWDEYKLLHRKYGRRCDWQGSWARNELEYQIEREKRSVW